jgi:hypothetical protein
MFSKQSLGEALMIRYLATSILFVYTHRLAKLSQTRSFFINLIALKAPSKSPVAISLEKSRSASLVGSSQFSKPTKSRSVSFSIVESEFEKIKNGAERVKNVRHEIGNVISSCSLIPLSVAQ